MSGHSSSGGHSTAAPHFPSRAPSVGRLEGSRGFRPDHRLLRPELREVRPGHRDLRPDRRLIRPEHRDLRGDHRGSDRHPSGHHRGGRSHWRHDCHGPWLWFGLGYGYGGYWRGYYGYGEYDTNGDAILDLDVDPEDAEVWLDGQLVGTADEFDGFPEYLYVTPGWHRLAFRLSGYESWEGTLTLEAGAYYKFENRLRATRGEGREPAESPALRPDSGSGAVRERLESDDVDEERPLRRPSRTLSRDFAAPAQSAKDRSSGGAGPSAKALLRIRVSPDDAQVWLDGLPIETSGRDEGIETAPGRHELVVMKRGYETAISTIDVKGTENDDFRIDLEAVEEADE